MQPGERLSTSDTLEPSASVLYGEHLSEHFERLEKRFERVEVLAAGALGRVEWTYDAKEHRKEVYRRIRELVADPAVQTFEILTINRPMTAGEQIPSEITSAIRLYYEAIETALQERDRFSYKRVVILRQTVNAGQEATYDPFADLRQNRPELVQHYLEILTSRNSAANIRFFRDTGRYLDVAFALTADAGRRPLAVAIELSILSGLPAADASNESQQALGILTLNPPEPPLFDTLSGTFSNIYEGLTDLPQVPEEEVIRRLSEDDD